MKNRKLISLILAVLTAVSALSLLSFGASAADGIAKNDNVVFVADGGSDDNAGTVDAPVATLAKAFEKLAETGGVAVLEGVVTIDKTNGTMPANKALVTVTSYYDGVDYRAKIYGSDKVTARLDLCNGTTSFNFGGDVTFDYVNFCIPGADYKNSIIAAYYNDLTIGANCATLFEDLEGTKWYEGTFGQETGARAYVPILLSGMNANVSGGERISDRENEGGVTITEPFTLSVASGDWQSVRIGDRDVANRNTIDCKATMNISGGRFVFFTGTFKDSNANLCVMGVYQANTSENAVIDVNITGGHFFGSIAGFGSVGAGGAMSAGDSFQNGTVNVNLNGGTYAREYNLDGTYIVPSVWLPFSSAALTDFGDKHCVNINIDTDKIAFDVVEAMTICGRDEMINVNVHITKYTDKIYVEDSIKNIKYDEGAPETTPAVTTEAPAPATTPAVTTKAPDTTTKAPDTTKAPETTPAATTGSSSGNSSAGSNTTLLIILAVAAVVVIVVVVVVIVKKKKA